MILIENLSNVTIFGIIKLLLCIYSIVLCEKQNHNNIRFLKESGFPISEIGNDKYKFENYYKTLCFTGQLAHQFFQSANAVFKGGYLHVTLLNPSLDMLVFRVGKNNK